MDDVARKIINSNVSILNIKCISGVAVILMGREDK
jgi:hypothetical protein